MGRVSWTREAELWLREIHDHIATDNPAAAGRTVRGIFERAQTLSAFPERGYRQPNSAGRPIRVLLYGHYRIAYLVKDGGDIDILGVFHGALDIDRFLP